MDAAVEKLAAQHVAISSSIVGLQFLRLGYPQVHRDGREAADGLASRLLELLRSDSAEQTMLLVGKSMC